jgi:tetratricopeptide (TPR) repeat protein
VKGNFSQRDAVQKDCLLRIGEARSALGDRDGALACLLPGREFSGPYAHAIGDAYRRAGGTDEAIAAYRFCLDKYPAYWNRSVPLLSLAECLRTKGRLDEALAALREVIEKCAAYPADCEKARKAITAIEEELKAGRR